MKTPPSAKGQQKARISFGTALYKSLHRCMHNIMMILHLHCACAVSAGPDDADDGDGDTANGVSVRAFHPFPPLLQSVQLS